MSRRAYPTDLTDAQWAILDSQSVKTTEKGGLAAMTAGRR